MPEFRWKAAGPSGTITEGRLKADNQMQALLTLRADGLTPIQVSSIDTLDRTPIGPSTGVVPPSFTHQGKRWKWLVRQEKVAASDILAMTSELSIMLKAGLALDNSLRVLIGMSANPAMVALTQAILDEVKGGATLSRVLEKRPQHFGDFYVNMIRSGEASGQLSAVLERLTEHLERIRTLRESVISAAIYPAILLGVAVLSLAAMLGFVVPQFETLFNGLGDALPLATRIIMNIGKAFKEYGLFILLGLFAFIALLTKWIQSPTGSRWWQARQLRLPVIGPILLKYDLTLYARSLGTLLGNGVPLIQALQIATLTVGNGVLRQALGAVIPKVKSGGKMVDAMGSSGIFEPLALSLIRVGEETGRISAMLLELARLSDRDVETGIKRGLTMLEPILILVLGVLIASIIVSILLGILSINDLAV